MSKSKRARSSKARSAPKIRSKAGTRKSAAPHHGARTNSKQARVLRLLRRANGATFHDARQRAVLLTAALPPFEETFPQRPCFLEGRRFSGPRSLPGEKVRSHGLAFCSAKSGCTLGLRPIID